MSAEAENRIGVEDSVGRKAEDGKLPSSVGHRRETLADVKKRWRCQSKTGKKPNTTSKLPRSPQMTTSTTPKFDYRAVSPDTATDSGYGSWNITPVFAQSEKSVTIPQSPFSDGWHELPSLFDSRLSPSSCYDEVFFGANPVPLSQVDLQIGNSTHSETSDESLPPSPGNQTDMTIAYAKHQMMVSIMQDVYAMFDSQWKANVRERTASQSSSPYLNSQRLESSDRPAQGKGKRRMQDRDSPPPDDNNEKRRKGAPPDPKRNDQNPQFACPFNKHDSRKYCANLDTGAKYRSCQAPGFSSISRLKQHLRRTHLAPIQCSRCWVTMPNMQAMTSHANTETRCTPRIAQPEGIDPEKMLLISSRHGVTWEDVFRILFPGAPVPNPYYEAHIEPIDGLGSSSPRSTEFRDFEAYNRTALPLLVEASLRTVVNAEMVPIEEHVRSLVVEIVRNCQTAVAQNYQLIVAPPSSTGDSIHSPPQSKVQNQTVSTENSILLQPAAVASNNLTTSFFQELPYLDADTSSSIPGPSYNPFDQDPNLYQAPDSGYGSLPGDCQCFCHSLYSQDSTGCENCTFSHLEPWNAQSDKATNSSYH